MALIPAQVNDLWTCWGDLRAAVSCYHVIHTEITCVCGRGSWSLSSSALTAGMKYTLMLFVIYGSLLHLV